MKKRTIDPAIEIDIEALQIHHNELIDWIKEVAALCKPKNIYLCNGTKTEYNELCNSLVEKGTFIKLDEKNGQTVMHVLVTKVMLLELKTKLLYVVVRKKMQVQQIIGWSLMK